MITLGRFGSTPEKMRTRFCGSAPEAIDGETRANAANNTNKSALPSAAVVLTSAKTLPCRTAVEYRRGKAPGRGTKTNVIKPIKRDDGRVESRLINFVAVR
jgi:hypothetical protein